VIVEALTDNRNRAASDIRSYFTKSGGNLGENQFGFLHVSTTPASSNMTPRSPPMMRCWMLRLKRAPTT